MARGSETLAAGPGAGDAATDSEGLVQRLEDDIVAGVHPPGARLREQALAAVHGVGRGPLREAIRVLEGRRLLERVPNAGVRVAAPTVDDLEQILCVREALEGLAARQAAEQITVAELKALRVIETRIARLDGEGPAGTEAVFRQGGDADFHRAVALASRNTWLVGLLCRDLYALMRLFRARAAALRSDPRRTHVEHRAVITCLERRDADGAEKAMRAHVRGSRERLLAHLRSAQGR